MATVRRLVEVDDGGVAFEVPAVAQTDPVLAPPDLAERIGIVTTRLGGYTNANSDELPTFWTDLDRHWQTTEPGTVPSPVIVPLAPNLHVDFAQTVLTQAGLGEQPLGSSRPVRALALSPDRRTVGRIANQFGEETDYAGLVEASTYSALVERARANPDLVDELADSVDLLVLLRPQDYLGTQTAAILRPLAERLLTLTTTRSLDTKEIRRVQRELRITKVLGGVTCREAIISGQASGVQLFVLQSVARVRQGRGRPDGVVREDFSAPELKGLIDNKQRNALILDTVSDLAASGRSGGVKCVSGYMSRHASKLSELAAESLKVKDKETGQMRPLRTGVYGSFQKPHQNDEILRQFDDGEIDTIFFSDIPPGWESEKMEYIVDACPVTSIDKKEALFGLGMAPKDRLTILVELYDQYASLRAPVSLNFDVIGESRIEQGIVVDGLLDATQPKRAAPKKLLHTHRREPRPLSVEQLQALRRSRDRLQGAIIAELTLGALRYKPLPPDWVRITDLPLTSLRSNYSLPSVMNRVARALGANGYQMIRSKGGMWGPPNTEQLVEEADLVLPLRGANLLSHRVVESRVGGISSELYDKVVAALGIDLINGRDGFTATKKRTTFMTAVDALRFEDYVAENYPYIDEDVDCAIREISEELGKHVSVVTKDIRREIEAGFLPGVSIYPRFTERRYERLCIDREHRGMVVDRLRQDHELRYEQRKEAFARLAAGALEEAEASEGTQPGSEAEAEQEANPTRLLSTEWRRAVEAGVITAEEADTLINYLTYFRYDPKALLPQIPEPLIDKVLTKMREGSGSDDDLEFVELLLTNEPKGAALQLVARRKLLIDMKKGDNPIHALSGFIQNKFGTLLCELR